MRWRAYAAALPRRERAKGAKRMTYWPNSSAKPERPAYRVILTPEAEAALRTPYRYIRRHAPRAARDWIQHARQRVNSLSHHPEPCPLARESVPFDEPIG